MMPTEPSHRTIRAAVLAALREPSSLLALAPGELDFTIRVLRRARILGRVARQLADTGALSRLDPIASDHLVGALALAESRERAARWELNRIEWALHGLHDVPVIVLKGGGYLLIHTPNAAGRLVSDVDLLVPEAMLGAVEQALRDHGWVSAELDPYDERYYRVWGHESPPLRHAERELEIDVHHNLVMRTARYRPDAAKLLADSRAVPGSRFRVLSPVDMTLHAIVHLFGGGEMDDALRDLVDIVDLMRHFALADPGYWEGFWPRAVELDLARPAFYGLRYARDILGAEVPESVIRQSATCRPARSVLAMMDGLVPNVLIPPNPDGRSRRDEASRLALYVRSHWVKMPPVMLARHLLRKSARRFGYGSAPRNRA